MKHHSFFYRLFFLVLLCGHGLFAQNRLLSNKMQYHRDTLRLSQMGTGVAALLRTIAEIQGLKNERVLLKHRIALKKLHTLMAEQKITPHRFNRLLKNITHYQKVASNNIGSTRATADLFAVAEDIAAPRSNWAETIAGAGATLASVNLKNDERIGKNLWLRGLLSILDGALGATRNMWYRSPEQLKWLTAGHAATRLAKMLAQHGVKKANKRAFLAYLLQAVRGVLGFVGEPRENQLGRVDLHGHLTLPNGERLYDDDGSLTPAALLEREVRLFRDPYHTFINPVETDPTVSAKRAATARAEVYRLEGEEVFNDADGTMLSFLPNGFGGQRPELPHSLMQGQRYYNKYIPGEGRQEPDWENIHQRVTASAGRDFANRFVSHHRARWQGGAVDHSFNDHGGFNTGKKPAWVLNKPAPDWHALEAEAGALLSNNAQRRAREEIKQARNDWDRKAEQYADQRGLPVYFGENGCLYDQVTGEPVDWENYVVWAPHKEEPHWFVLARNAVIAKQSPRQVVQADNAWQEDKRLYEAARARGDRYYFDSSGLLRLADDAATQLELNGDNGYDIFLPHDGSTPADEPMWGAILRPPDSKDMSIDIRIEKALQVGRSAWSAHFYLERIAPFAHEEGWQYYFAADGSLISTETAELVSRNEGSYGALTRVPGRDEPNWEHLGEAAKLIPERRVRDSVIIRLAQHKRAWEVFARGEDPLCGVRIASDGTLRFDNGAGPQPPEMSPQFGANGYLMQELAAENSYWNAAAEVVNVPHLFVFGHFVPMRVYRVADCLSPFTYGVSQEPNWAALRAEADRVAPRVAPNGYANMRAYEWIGAYEALWARCKERDQAQAAAAEAARAAALDRERAAAATAVITDLPLPVDAACLICGDDAAELEHVARNSNTECSCNEALFCQDCAVRAKEETGTCPMCRKPFTGITYYRPVADMDLS